MRTWNTHKRQKMAWHGHQQQYDPTTAFIKNSREQKLLDIRLDELEKLWFAELKHLAKERLDVKKELSQFEEEKRHLQYFDKKMLVSDLKRYTDGVIEQFRKGNREKSARDHFNFDTSAIQERRLSISLPRLDKVGFCDPGLVPNKHVMKRPNTKRSTRSVPRQRKLSSSNSSSILKATRHISVSDPNLHNTTSFAELRGTSVTSRFPPINTTSKLNPDYRYLKHRMATTLVELPPVKEVSNISRKMSF